MSLPRAAIRVSVVIPAYNVDQWVGAALDSVLSQSLAPHEVIVVDDGSTDRTTDVLAGFKDVRVIRQDNQGLAGARNAGAAEAAGACDAIFFLDADDQLAGPTALAEFASALERHPNAGVVTSNYTRLPTGAAAGEVAWPGAYGERVLQRHQLGEIVRRNRLQANSLLRIQIWKAFPFQDGVIGAEDLDLWLRLLLAGVPVVVLGAPLVQVLLKRPGALTTRRNLMRASRRRVFESLSAHREKLTSRERLLTAYQLVRASLGEFAESDNPSQARNALATSPAGLVRATERLLRVPGLPHLLRKFDRGDNPS